MHTISRPRLPCPSVTKFCASVASPFELQATMSGQKLRVSVVLATMLVILNTIVQSLLLPDTLEGRLRGAQT